MISDCLRPISVRRLPISRPRLFGAWPALLLAAFALFAAGCAKKPLPSYDNAERAWNVFQAGYRVRPPAPAFVAACSLAWTSGNRSARILLDFWGEFDQHNAGSVPAVVRMDAWSNLGGSLSKLRQGPDGLAAFYPDQMKAYTHADPILGARLLGLPFPFSLADFAALLHGDFTDLIPARYDSVTALDNGAYRFGFANTRVQTLTLDKAARPLRMTGRTVVPEEYADSLGGEWRIDFSRYPDEPDLIITDKSDGLEQTTRVQRAPMAHRLFLTLPGGHRGSLRIQSRELKLRPWPEQATALRLPEAVQPRALDGVQRDWTTGRVPASAEASPAAP